MWPFTRSCSLAESGLFEGFTDWHSHILPAVDDGVRSVEEALGILHGYEALGMKTVWLTPHIMEEMPNTPESLKRKFEELQTAYSGRIELHLAAEHMLDNLFDERLDGNDLLPIGRRGDHLLVETSYFNPPLDLEGTLLPDPLARILPAAGTPRAVCLHVTEGLQTAARSRSSLPARPLRIGRHVRKAGDGVCRMASGAGILRRCWHRYPPKSRL